MRASRSISVNLLREVFFRNRRFGASGELAHEGDCRYNDAQIGRGTEFIPFGK